MTNTDPYYDLICSGGKIKVRGKLLEPDKRVVYFPKLNLFLSCVRHPSPGGAIKWTYEAKPYALRREFDNMGHVKRIISAIKKDKNHPLKKEKYQILALKRRVSTWEIVG